jgi:DNA helicase-2/ATP-dependent DNA helicase PcrA
MLDFKKYYKDATIVTLDQNYRSTQTIIEASAALIANNEGRLHNDLWTDNQRGVPITVAEAYNEEEEAELVLREAMRLRKDDRVRYGDMAIMYRINAQSRAMEVACNRHGRPYQLVGGLKFYDRKEMRDLIAYLRVITNPADNIALERIVNTPARGISQRTIDAAREHAEAYGVSLWEGINGIENVDHELNSALNKRAVNSLVAFVDQIKFLADRSHQISVVELIDVTLERSGYKRLIQEDTDRGEERWDNLLELRGTAAPYDGPEPRAQLLEFLENAALVSDVDRMKDADESEQITLITLHQAKGLEFDTVFMIGVEEGMLPHSRSLESAAELEEERRLCYVGMTRAENRLYMLRAFNRSFRGMRGPTIPSRFLDELPEKYLQRASSASVDASDASTDTKERTQRRSAARNVTRTGIDPNIRTPMQRRADLARPAPTAADRPVEGFKTGELVTHSTFGEGIILGVEASGGDSLLTVVFKSAGQKKLSASYAPLVRVPKPPPEGNNGDANESADQAAFFDAG